MLSFDARSRSKLAFMGVLLTPVLAVQGVRLFFDSSAAPALAGASVTVPAPTAAPAPGPIPSAPAKPLTEQQRAAMVFARGLAPTGDIRSPFDRPDPAPVQAQAEPQPQTPAPVPAPIPDAAPKMTISGMIADEAGGLVSINHKLYRVGDEIAKGWTLVRIDSKSRTVRIRHADGREIELSPAQPSLRNSEP